MVDQIKPEDVERVARAICLRLILNAVSEDRRDPDAFQSLVEGEWREWEFAARDAIAAWNARSVVDGEKENNYSAAVERYDYQPDPMHTQAISAVSNNVVLPLCLSCNSPMVLYMWDRPGGAPGNGWGCTHCKPYGMRPISDYDTAMFDSALFTSSEKLYDINATEQNKDTEIARLTDALDKMSECNDEGWECAANLGRLIARLKAELSIAQAALVAEREKATDRDKLAEFAMWAFREGAFVGCDLDGGSIQEAIIPLLTGLLFSLRCARQAGVLEQSQNVGNLDPTITTASVFGAPLLVVIAPTTVMASGTSLGKYSIFAKSKACRIAATTLGFLPKICMPNMFRSEYILGCPTTFHLLPASYLFATLKAFERTPVTYIASGSFCIHARVTDPCDAASSEVRDWSCSAFRTLHATRSLIFSVSRRASWASFSRLAARSLAFAASAFASSLRACEALIWLSAPFCVASVISYPIHAETNALMIPTAPKTSALIVAHLNTADQNGSVNSHIPLSFWFLVGGIVCLSAVTVGLCWVVIKVANRMKERGQLYVSNRE